MQRTLEYRVGNMRVLELCPALRLGMRAGRCAWRIRLPEAFNGCPSWSTLNPYGVSQIYALANLAGLSIAKMANRSWPTAWYGKPVTQLRIC